MWKRKITVFFLSTVQYDGKRNEIPNLSVHNLVTKFQARKKRNEKIKRIKLQVQHLPQLIKKLELGAHQAVHILFRT